MEIRAPRPRTRIEDLSGDSPVSGPAAASASTPEAASKNEEEASKTEEERLAKRQRVEQHRRQDPLAIALDGDSDLEITGVSEGPARPLQVEPLLRPQVLRISAGRAAAAAGIHPFADVWELFVELLYQDQPELLLMDAARAGVEVVSPVAERARLLGKSGEARDLEEALAASKESLGVEGTQAAQEAVKILVDLAEQGGRLTQKDAGELRDMLNMEINVEFGARHEDAAIEAYSAQVGTKVYGEQRRVSVPLPPGGPETALAQVFPMPSTGVGDAKADAQAAPKPYFRLTGFIDGMVDLPRHTPRGGGDNHGQSVKETLVVEVKHRMAKIKDPPEIYDVVQLGSYCRAFGCSSGHLVQCLRSGPGVGKAGKVGTLHVTRVDYSEGSRDRKGWDKHVLPSLYATAAAVYAVREDQEARVRLLAASPLEPSARRELVGEYCAHLGK